MERTTTSADEETGLGFPLNATPLAALPAGIWPDGS